MKEKAFIIVALLMVSSMASAQQAYINVELKDGTIHSYNTMGLFNYVKFGEKEEKDSINGHAYVELAGLKWATENVANMEKGATAVGFDFDYGLYYALANDEAKKAAESWGATWRLPTTEDWQALLDSCYWVYVTATADVTRGFIVYKALCDEDKGRIKGKYYEDKGCHYYSQYNYESSNPPHIFLPSAGICNEGNVGGTGTDFYYWTADKDHLMSTGISEMEIVDEEDDFPCYYGMSVRPVSD